MSEETNKRKEKKNFQKTDTHEACVNIGTVALCGCGILWSLYCRVFIHTTGLTHWIPGTSFSLLQPKLTANTAKCPLEVKTTGWESRTIGLDFGSLEFVPCYSCAFPILTPPTSVGPFVFFHSHLVLR